MQDDTGDGSAQASDRSGAIISTISRDVVGIYTEFIGRGPSRAKTFWQDGLVVCLLEEVFGRPEQTLVDAGRFDQVRGHRQMLHETIEPLLRSSVEAATGFQVVACLGQVVPEGIAVETFILGERLPRPGV